METTVLADRSITVTADSYQLRVEGGRPRAHIADPQGLAWSSLSLLSDVNVSGYDADMSWGWQAPRVEVENDHQVTITVICRSHIWDHKEITLHLYEDHMSLRTRVLGGPSQAKLTTLTWLGGNAILPTGACGQFYSSIDVPSLFIPNPTQPIACVRPSAQCAVISGYGDADSGRLNAVFSPAPFFMALGRKQPLGPTEIPDGDWLGMCVRCDVEEARFTRWTYEAIDAGFLTRLDYDGHTLIGSSWTSPQLVLIPSSSPVMDLVSWYADDLRSHGLASSRVPNTALWHRQPIFCGWGAQCARAASMNRASQESEASGGLVGGGLAVAAPALAREDLYNQWLKRLADADIHPGIVVIDDRWQSQYGTNEADTEKWPDMRRWIAQQHEEGKHVLLWWKAWDPEGVDPRQCLRTPDGVPVAVDPDSPAYQERIRSIVSSLLGSDGLGADGFKVDFTQRLPVGACLQRADDVDSGSAGEISHVTWGIALLHRLLSILHDAAHTVRPDALVVTHTVNPWFADVADMIRLNDVFERDTAGLPVPVAQQLDFRAAVTSHTLPGFLIDTDQWPMPSKQEWHYYLQRQYQLGVPALYYLESIDNSGENLEDCDLAVVRAAWQTYRKDQHLEEPGRSNASL